MHGGTQTIRFWGLQHVHMSLWQAHVHWTWFLRLQSRLVWDVPKALQGRQGMCGSLAGWFQVAIQAVDWFVPEHHLSIGLRCVRGIRSRSRAWENCHLGTNLGGAAGSPVGFDAWWHANNPLLGATTCPLVWRLMLLVLAAAKQVGLRCSQGFARSTGDVRQPGRLVSGGYPGRRLVCSRASSIYWFKVSFLRGSPSNLTAWIATCKQSAFGGYNMSTGVKAHVAGSCGCKAGWFEMFPRLCKVDRGCAAAWQVGFRWLSRP